MRVDVPSVSFSDHIASATISWEHASSFHDLSIMLEGSPSTFFYIRGVYLVSCLGARFASLVKTINVVSMISS
jgi:hypothetical protein